MSSKLVCKAPKNGPSEEPLQDLDLSAEAKSGDASQGRRASAWPGTSKGGVLRAGSG